jgi:hypothetical protein
MRDGTPIDAEGIADMADRGQNVSAHFTNQFTVVRGLSSGSMWTLLPQITAHRNQRHHRRHNSPQSSRGIAEREIPGHTLSPPQQVNNGDIGPHGMGPLP